MKVWGASVQGLILHTEEARVRLLARNAQRIEMQDEDNVGEFEEESGTWRQARGPVWAGCYWRPEPHGPGQFIRVR